MSNDRNVNDNPEAFTWNGLCSPEINLRDYFAARAMQEMINANGIKPTKATYTRWGLEVGDFHGLVAKCAYALADRMLEARKCDD